jgi:hypothetical protein
VSEDIKEVEVESKIEDSKDQVSDEPTQVKDID